MVAVCKLPTFLVSLVDIVSMNRIYNKRPQEHRKRCHYNSKGVAKLIFKNQEEAVRFIKRKHLLNYIPYLCHECSFWHIGRKTDKADK